MADNFEKRILIYAFIILVVSFILFKYGNLNLNPIPEIGIEQRLQLELKYQQNPQGTQLFVNVKCESMLKPISKITGAVFGVDLCKKN